MSYNARYYKKNRERLLAAQKAYYRRNRERVKAYNRDRRERKRDEIRAKSKAWRAANPEKCYSYTIWKRYGMSYTEYVARKRKTACEICAKPLRSQSEKHLDHCHVSGQVRGVLCGVCNRGLGALRDDVKLLRKAIKYLLKYRRAA